MSDGVARLNRPDMLIRIQQLEAEVARLRAENANLRGALDIASARIEALEHPVVEVTGAGDTCDAVREEVRG